MAHDVFISHSEKDKTFADATCACLESHAIRCWIAPRDVLPGTDWSEAIIDAIGNSRLMVLVFSSHANDSQFVKFEVERAVNRGICIIPIRIEDVPMGKSLELFVSTRHWLDAMTTPLQAHLDRLAETVRTLLGQPAIAPAAEAPKIAEETPTPAVESPKPMRPMVPPSIEPVTIEMIESNRHGAKAAIEIGAVAVLFWIASMALQQMSGPALSMPASWRYSVRGISAVLAIAIFSFLKQQSPLGSESPRKKRRNWVAFLAIGTAAAFLIVFKVVSSACIIHWDSRDWLTQELAVDASRPSMKTSAGKEGELDANANVDTFLDTADGDLYIPLFFPRAQQGYLEKVSKAYGEDGLSWELENEPDKLIDWLRGPCREQLQFTTAIFFALHMAVICSLAAGGALAYSRRDAIFSRFLGTR